MFLTVKPIYSTCLSVSENAPVVALESVLREVTPDPLVNELLTSIVWRSSVGRVEAFVEGKRLGSFGGGLRTYGLVCLTHRPSHSNGKTTTLVESCINISQTCNSFTLAMNFKFRELIHFGNNSQKTIFCMSYLCSLINLSLLSLC
jgi:hypothetical protein